MTTLSVMGVGKVGGEVAFLAAALGLVDEINLYDTYTPLLDAQILDLCHTGLDITVTRDPRLIADADIFVFAAGVPRTPEIRTRADLLEANIPVADICSKYLGGFGGVLITVTNPMDANNYYIFKKSGLAREQCIGFGGMLDAARFARLLAEEGISGEAWVLGEHGEHQVPVFSALAEVVEVAKREEILSRMRTASMEVIRGKGGTVFGPAYHIVTLMRAIIRDEQAILPCSCVLEGEYGISGCSLGVPARIGKGGVREILEWELDAWEQEHLQQAAAFVTGLSRRGNE
jgi:malate dehydrogenase